MGGIVEGGGYARQAGQHDGHKEHRHAAHGCQRGGIDAAGVLAGLIGEAEKGGFHAEGEEHQQQGHVAVDLGDDAVAARGCR